jgi:C-methyltransferase
MSTANPAETLLNLSTAYWASRCLHIAAEVGVADALHDEPETALELAKKTGTDPGALHRVLRALANRGIFELKGGRFSHNDASRLLCTNAEGSMRSRAVIDGLPVHWNAYGALGHSLQTGRPAVESIIKEPNFFAYLGAHPDEARIFAGAMVGKSSSGGHHHREIGWKLRYLRKSPAPTRGIPRTPSTHEAL